MAQRAEAPAAKPDHLSSVPGTHMAGENSPLTSAHMTRPPHKQAVKWFFVFVFFLKLQELGTMLYPVVPTAGS